MKNELKLAGLCFTPEYGAEEHIAYIATVTLRALRNIIGVQRILKTINDCHCLELWDHSLKVYSQIPRLDSLTPVAGTAEALAQQGLYDEEENDFDADRDEVATECLVLKITVDDFLWTWYPRHLDNKGECSTARFTAARCLKLLEIEN